MGDPDWIDTDIAVTMAGLDGEPKPSSHTNDSLPLCDASAEQLRTDRFETNAKGSVSLSAASHVNPLPAGDPRRTQQQDNAPPSTSKPSQEHLPACTSLTPATSRRCRFLSFPPEIRIQIYEYCCHLPDSRSLYAQYNRQIDDFYYAARRAGNSAMDFPIWQARLTTPAVLLLCRQITRECRPMLESSFLVIDRLPPWPKGALRPVPVTKFITKDTLQSVKRLELRFTLGQGKEGSGWYWIKVIGEIADILLERNSFKELRIVICEDHDADAANTVVWEEDETRHLRCFVEKVSPLQPLRMRTLGRDFCQLISPCQLRVYASGVAS